MPGLLNILPTVIDMFGRAFGIDMTSDDNKIKLANLQLEATKIASEELKAQMEVNAAEASAPGRTWLTWREALGYVCVMAVAYHFIIQQFIAFVCNALGHPVILPVLEIAGLMSILTGMLGIHAVDSVYNSPRGTPPTIGQKNTPNQSGRLVNGVWTPN
jgi:hypothetical protein